MVVGRAPWVFLVLSMTKYFNDRAEIAIDKEKYHSAAQNDLKRKQQKKINDRARNRSQNGSEEYLTKYAGA